MRSLLGKESVGANNYDIYRRVISDKLLWQRAGVFAKCRRIGRFSNRSVGEDGDCQDIYNFPLIGCLLWEHLIGLSPY